MAAEEPSPLEQAGLRFQASIFEEALRERPDDTEALRFLSHAYAGLGRLQDGLAADERLVQLLPQDPRVRYNLACSLALTGRDDDALDALRHACALGFDDLALLRRDSDLDSVREDPRYREIEAELARRSGE